MKKTICSVGDPTSETPYRARGAAKYLAISGETTEIGIAGMLTQKPFKEGARAPDWKALKPAARATSARAPHDALVNAQYALGEAKGRESLGGNATGISRKPP